LTGQTFFISRSFAGSSFGPLVKTIEEVLGKLRADKGNTEESGSGIWTSGKLRYETEKLFGDSRLCVIANREPYIHNRKGEGIVETVIPASGLVTALEPIVRACSGLWIGHGSGTADRETADKNGSIMVPPENPEYTLKRVWLSSENVVQTEFHLKNGESFSLIDFAPRFASSTRRSNCPKAGAMLFE
jgi:trehalose 6-phosphate synthase